jgi:L-alanine-DL-glutamate epimerase-like enolase superfamily enzyme
VTLDHGHHRGRGEAAGVYYRNDTCRSMAQQLESVRATVQAGISIDLLQRLLPPGGARNALDCALWDLLAKVRGQPVWAMLGLTAPLPLLTTFTCGADSPERMAGTARTYEDARAIKLKLTGEPVDADRVRQVRQSLPEVWIGVDGNQGFTREALDRLMPVLIEANVSLIEQPLPVGQEALLEGFGSPIPLAADESAQSLADMPLLANRFDIVNIKLDKCGGLTHGLAMARTAREFGLQTMVGNMIGTSLSMAPAFLIGQLCEVVDLDGAMFLKADRPNGVSYQDGFATYPSTLWGE